MKAAELCAGYGGLALAVNEVFGSTTAWFSEFEDAPSKILAHHWPNVPNHGDMTKIDWTAVEPVDIIAGGTPCQDLSGAGKRAGMSEGTRSNLWVQMREAIAVIQPKYVVWENVRGAYSASAFSELESREGRMGGAGGGGPVLRALGRVLGDLSDLGYDCQWRGLRAADVGAPHGRFRVFILATYTSGLGGREALECNGGGKTGSDRAGVPNQSDRESLRTGSLGEAAADPISEHRGERRQSGSSEAQGGRASAIDSGRGGTPIIAHPFSHEPERWGGIGNLECAPGASQDDSQERERIRETSRDSGHGNIDWGIYAPAIRRWETMRGTAPNPTEPTGRNGNHRLSARFTEWMMGLPNGWIVDVPGVTRNEALKAAGNGVVPQQAIAALRDMLTVEAVAA